MKFANAGERIYQGKNVNINVLVKDIQDWLEQRGFETQSQKAEDKDIWLLQARKSGFFRTIVAATRAFTIVIEGEPNRFSVRVGISEWITNLTAVGLAALLTVGITLIGVVISASWTKKIQGDIKKYIDQRVVFGRKGEHLPEGGIIGMLERELNEKKLALEQAFNKGALTKDEYEVTTRALELDFELHKKVMHLKEAKDKKVLLQEEYDQKIKALKQEYDQKIKALKRGGVSRKNCQNGVTH